MHCISLYGLLFTIISACTNAPMHNSDTIPHTHTEVVNGVGTVLRPEGCQPSRCNSYHARDFANTNAPQKQTQNK